MTTEVQTADEVVRIIEKERLRQGMSQRRLCSEAGLSHGAYYFVKNGGGVHLDTALRLLTALGASVQVDRP